MRDSRKVDVLIQWLNCFNVTNAKLSELGDGLKLLKLLSSIKPECAAEDVAPAEAFVPTEQILIGLHGSLPPGFLLSATESDCHDGILALAADLALSSVVLHATRCGATKDMRPLLALEEASQPFIKDVVQTASAGDSVLKNLRSSLRAKTSEARPSAAISPPSRPANSASFTFSPTSAVSPPEPSPLKTPERRPLKSELEERMGQHEWESSALRANIDHLEEARARLEAEGSQLTQHSAQHNLSITELHIKLLRYKTLAVQLEPGLTVREDHLDDVNDQAEVIGNGSSAAGDVVELLESNVDLDVASRSSEAAQATQGHSSCQAVAEKGSHLGASPEQYCSVCTEDEDDLEAVIMDVAEGFDSLSSDILAEGVDLPQPELREGSSSLTLSKQPSCVEGEKGAQSPLALEM
ncbi:uncharacterized protein LOC144169861 [Haemaphysalis longicornis]